MTAPHALPAQRTFAEQVYLPEIVMRRNLEQAPRPTPQFVATLAANRWHANQLPELNPKPLRLAVMEHANKWRQRAS